MTGPAVSTCVAGFGIIRCMSADETAVGRPRPLSESDQKPCILVLSGAAIGQMFRLEGRKWLIGRSEQADIRLDDEGVSREHAKLMVVRDGVIAIKDLGSRNGTFVGGKPIKQWALEDGDRIQVGSVTILKFSYHDQLEEQFQRHLYDSATRDGLTRLFNRRYFDETLKRELSLARRHGEALSLLVLDIDRFKEVNDTRGHVAGDAILRQLGPLLERGVRTEDAPCRVGGEEFAVIAPRTDLLGALALAGRLRKAVSTELRRDEEGRIPLTVSIGVGTFDPAKHESVETFFREVDGCLYEAKQSGRDRICSKPD